MKTEIHCPHFRCPGIIKRIKNIYTGQIVHICSEDQIFFAGDRLPTKYTLCCRGKRYDTMLGLDADFEGYAWRATELAVSVKWDVEAFFSTLYNPQASPNVTKNRFGDKGINTCTFCRQRRIIHSHIDNLGRKHEYDEIYDTTLTPILIHKTNQELLYCKTCGQVFPEYREPEDSNGCKLDFYLAMLGILN
jgi:hypothetical protein